MSNMMTTNKQEVIVPEVMAPTAIEAQERAQVDIQISTAKRYPRQLSLVKQRMLSFATLDEETAAGCFYTLPARKGGDGKPIQGASVRLAEIAIASYQHIKAGSRIIDDDGKFITAQGVVHDLENNVCVSIEVKRRVTNKAGIRYSDDMIATTGNAACSLALRNAAFRVIPLALVKPVYEAAKRLAVGDAKSLVQRRAACIEHFSKLGISKERVCEAVQCRAVDDIQIDHLEILMGYSTAIKDGDAKIDDIFPEPVVKVESPDFGKDAKQTDLNGDEIPEREPAKVEVMNKADLLKELKQYEGTAELDALIDDHIPEDCQLQQAPKETLAAMLTKLQKGGE